MIPSSALALALVLVWFGYNAKTTPDFVVPANSIASVASAGSDTSIYSESFIFPKGLNAYNHASSLIELNNGQILAVWYGGSREGATDVRIYKSVFDPENSSWSKPEAIIGAAKVSRDLARYVKKIGNPVLHRDDEGKLWIFFVTVSVGGWSGSSLNYIISEDEGVNWSKTSRLITSPFINVSTLVKGQPFNFTDGSIGLPVYHELAGKFSELLRIRKDGKVINKTRITHGRKSLQPSIAILDKKNAIALMRYSGKAPKRILSSTTTDGGLTWSPGKKISLPNPNSGLMVRAIAENKLLLVFNNTEHGRNILSLAVSGDRGKTWKVIHDFEHSTAESEDRFSYPYFIKTKSGSYHLTYTWKKHLIKHVVFNDRWLKNKINN
ncbi:MAG: exo-alpha-sialidase [Acidiferrobacterales bacterium]